MNNNRPPESFSRILSEKLQIKFHWPNAPLPHTRAEVGEDGDLHLRKIQITGAAVLV